MISLDTLSYAKRLQATGVPSEQAEAHAMALSDVLVHQAASKADLTVLGARLESFIKEQLSILRAELRTEVQQQKVEILKWIFAAALGQTSLIVAAIRYLPH